MDQIIVYAVVSAVSVAVGVLLSRWVQYAKDNAKARLLAVATKALAELDKMRVNQGEVAAASARQASEAAMLQALKDQAAKLS